MKKKAMTANHNAFEPRNSMCCIFFMNLGNGKKQTFEALALHIRDKAKQKSDLFIG